VETVHRLVEDQSFDLDSFSSRDEFLAEAHADQVYFSFQRSLSLPE
jgi:hypothetical protein